MAQIIGLPKLSPTMEEGVLVRWVKKEGDAVEPGELVAEVETDKANMDFNLEDEGVLLKLLVAEGDTVKLGAPVAILGEEGEDVSDLLAEAEKQIAGGGDAAAPAAAEPEEAPAPPPSPAPAPAAPPPPAKSPSPAPPAAAPSAAPPKSGKILASPLAKTLALELGVDLRSVAGSGPGGRIVERDVRAAADGAPGAAAPDGQPAQQPRAAQQAEPAQAAQQAPEENSTALAVIPPGGLAVPGTSDDYVDRPLSGMRKTIAERLTQAKRDIPHFRLTSSFDAERLMAFRERLNKLLGDQGKVSVNDLLLKGVALALRRVPEVNAAFTGEAIRYYTRVHLGVAVALERGLITPVVRHADLKGIGVISAEVRDLVQRAKDRQLKAEEIQGSTFTVSNLGMFGIDHFDAIINPPEAAILAVGRMQKVPVVEGDRIAIGQRVNMTLSCDHRVVDGALGARFLQNLVDILERPESLAL